MAMTTSDLVATGKTINGAIQGQRKRLLSIAHRRVTRCYVHIYVVLVVYVSLTAKIHVLVFTTLIVRSIRNNQSDPRVFA